MAHTVTPIDWNPAVAVWEAIDLPDGSIAASERILWQGSLEDLRTAHYGVLLNPASAGWTVVSIAGGHEEPLNGYRL